MECFIFKCDGHNSGPKRMQPLISRRWYHIFSEKDTFIYIFWLSPSQTYQYMWPTSSKSNSYSSGDIAITRNKIQGKSRTFKR